MKTGILDQSGIDGRTCLAFLEIEPWRLEVWKKLWENVHYAGKNLIGQG